MTFTTTQPRLPADVSHLAYTSRLGQLLGIYDKPKMMRIVIPVWILLLFCMVVGLGLAADSPVPGAVAALVLLVLLPFGLAIWVGTLSPVFSRRARRRKIYTFGEGFVQVTRHGPVAHRWDSVAWLYQAIVRQYTNGIYTGTNYRYRFVYLDGTKSRMTHFTADMSVLGGVINEMVTDAQRPHAVAAVRSGQTLSFGDLTINAQGIATSRKALKPWNQIARIDVVRGYVKVIEPGRRTTYVSRQCAKTPNLGLFLFLARRMAGGGAL
jgi:hypothetical protein